MNILLFKIYSWLRVWRKNFLNDYMLYRYGRQISSHGKFDLDHTARIVFQTSTSKLVVGSGFLVRSYCSVLLTDKGEIRIGDNVFLNRCCSLNAMEMIVIGDNTILGENVKIYDHNHLFRDRTQLIRDQGFKKAPVRIGKNCWIGSDCTILPGVTIGDNVVVGAGNLIYKSIEANSVIVSKREIINLNSSEL